MKSKTIEMYKGLHEAILQERDELTARAEELQSIIDGLLGEERLTSKHGRRNKAVKTPKSSKTEKTSTPGRRGRRSENSMSLRDAVVQVTKNRPLEKDAILDAVQKGGYKFSTNNPMASINQVLYNKKFPFKNEDGKWTPDFDTRGAQEEEKPRVKAAEMPEKEKALKAKKRKVRKPKSAKGEETGAQEK